MNTVRNRWVVAAGAVGVHLPIGSVYAYSVLTVPLNTLHGWVKSDVTMAFGLAILLLGLSAAFLGPKVERIGAKKAARVCAALYTFGIAGAGLGIHLGLLPLFILSYGVIGGIGLGIGYIAPVSTLLKWFPDRRGMASGLAVMGFGFGSLVFGPVMVTLMESLPVWAVLYLLSCVYGALIFLASCALTPPPEGWEPPAQSGAAKQGRSSQAAVKKPEGMLEGLSIQEVLRTRQFMFLWLMVFANIVCGISIISVASPMAQEMTGMTPLQAAGLVGTMGLLNGLGRFGWASISDYIGRIATYMIFFTLQCGLFLLLAATNSQALFYILVLVMVSCYGGGFSCLPAFISDIFGVRQLGTSLGYVLTAWGVAGIVGPVATSLLVSATGSYVATLYILSAVMVAAFVISLCMLASNRRSAEARQLAGAGM